MRGFLVGMARLDFEQAGASVRRDAVPSGFFAAIDRGLPTASESLQSVERRQALSERRGTTTGDAATKDNVWSARASVADLVS